ncbi:uncharacterized protein MONOS_14704 [Monocercomonoides exilis]|uniref:uncharacterized protein n=1 Tax=Monocercomonoides exilis TaxID=2049356 RepID=UPI003559D3C6|nr:hypothetical protein MONOS_14704 [Monocercomonoides exilis]|eukprot:MONOS_14704.1-p1 / transcript=MONOS_14704.1 / gene=MONOS_14704 / organism=Monocercomonoides_exilis_PA203 / gene_product=unspecified product / transcript_product=unspecified product / location=Mono_scaffold01054:16448-16750(-) / protein_length=101 / sequence_SO=supercontig / SO=protein_coding / is_pseudo=false
MVFVSYALSAAMDGIERQLCIVVSEEGWMLANQKKSLLRTTQKLADSYVVARREVLYGDDIYIKDMELSAMFLVQLISQFPSQIELVESEVGEQEDVCGS